MESKKINRLSQIINNEEAMKEAMASIERFMEYPAPEINGNALNALAAYALDSKYKEKNMESLGVSNLPDEACQILFREYFKVYTAKHGNIVGELTGEMDDALKAFKKRFEALYPTKDANAISAWLYRKLHWKVCLSNADKEEISTRIEYLVPQKAYCHLRTLKLLCFEESEGLLLTGL